MIQKISINSWGGGVGLYADQFFDEFYTGIKIRTREMKNKPFNLDSYNGS